MMDAKVKEHALCCIDSSLNRDVRLLDDVLSPEDECKLYKATLLHLKYLIENNPVQMFEETIN